MTAEPSTRVTLRQVYQEQQEMKELLQKVASSLPTVARRLDEHERDTNELLKDHEIRLRNIEQKVWKLFGAIALIAGAAPFLARLLP